jgi:hypothetical protein
MQGKVWVMYRDGHGKICFYELSTLFPNFNLINLPSPSTSPL